MVAESGVGRIVKSPFRLRAILAATALLGSTSTVHADGPAAKPPLVLFTPAGTAAGSNEASFADVSNPHVEIPITLAEQTGQSVTVRLQASPFVNPSARIVQPIFSDTGNFATSLTLAPYEVKHIDLRAELLDAGTYRCVIDGVIVSAQGQTPVVAVSLTVTRTKGLPPVELDAVPVIPATIGLLSQSIDVVPTFTLIGTGGPVTLSLPRLQSATWKPKVDSTTAQRTSLQLGPFDPARRSIPMDAGLVQPVNPDFYAIRTPGRYDVTLRFTAPGYLPLDGTVAIYVRQSVPMAVFWIALGVLASLCVHGYGSFIRPRLLVQQRVIALRLRLDKLRAAAEGDSEATDMVTAVEAAIGRQWESARQRRVVPGNDFDIYDDVVRAMAPWIALHAQVMALRSPQVRSTLLKSLADIGDVFRAEPPDATKLAAAFVTLRDMPKTVRSQVTDALVAEVKTLDGQLAVDTRPAIVAIRSRLAGIRSAIAQDQIESAIAQFEQTRRGLIDVLVEDLRTRLAAEPQPPLDANSLVWAALRAQTTTTLDRIAAQASADAALSTLTEAVTYYLNAVSAALRPLLRTCSSKVAKDANDLLQRMDTALQAGALPDAWRAFDAARKLIDGAQRAIAFKAAGGKMGGALGTPPASQPAAPPSAEFDVAAVFNLLPAWETLDSPSTARMTEGALSTGDVLVSACVLIAAVATGLQVLYVDDPTWGGWPAYLAAFVWGFATDQFTHAGIGALSKK